MNWLILRITHGNPFRIEEAISWMHIPAYLPQYHVKRRDPRDRSRVFEVRKPLLPGYMFVAANEDWNTTPIRLTPSIPLESIPPVMLALARERSEQLPAEERRKPTTIDCRVRWLTLGDRPLAMTADAMTALRESEKAENGKWRPFVDDVINAFAEIGRGVRPKRFVKLADWQHAAA